MEIRDKLITFARFVACPYVRNLDAVKPYIDSVSIILVGSVATGMCNPSSDVDICILCNRETYNNIQPNIDWNAGKYMEMNISGIKTRYYLEIIEDVIEGLNKLDDLTFYLYTSAIPLDDVSRAYKNILSYIDYQQLSTKRKRYVFTAMMKRRRKLSAYLSSYTDPFGRLTVAYDILKSVLRAIAVYDSVPFDPKKHPYHSALIGSTGTYLKPCLDDIMMHLYRIQNVEDAVAQKEFITLIDNCISAIS